MNGRRWTAVATPKRAGTTGWPSSTSSNRTIRRPTVSFATWWKACLVVNLAVDHANYVDTGKAGQGTQAVRALYERDGKAPAVSGMPLPEFDGGRMLHGIWETLHPSGSHPAVRCGRGALQDAALHRARAIPAEALPSKATIPIGKLRSRASRWGD